MTLINKKISVIVPCRNEEANILPLYERLVSVLSKITTDWEIIYTDNGSTDNSGKIFRDLAQKDSRVSVIFFSRNFGTSDHGYTAGSEQALGDAIIWIDGDIQDPPELIEEFVKKWQEGYEVIYGIRKKREGSFPKRLGYKFFYKIFCKLSYIDIPRDAGDFSLVDRKVINIINSMPERDRFVRGLRAWAGFRSTGIDYERAERKKGSAKTNYWSYFRSAKKGIFSFSYLPLEIVSLLALLVTFLSVLAILFYFGWYLISPNAPSGYMTLLMIILFLGSIQLLSISIIGEYLGKIFEEVKRRPKYIVREILNDHRQIENTN